MANICIIPARGGSKRIPRKNIKLFLGKPIISYAIEIARNSGLFDTIMVSTDDEGIAEIAKSYGAEVPFFRSKGNANDFATTADVLVEVLDNYKKQGQLFDDACCLYPCTPLLNEKLLTKAHQKLIHNNYDVVFPVLKYSYPIQRSLVFDNDKIRMKWSEYLKSRSQDLEESFHDSGQFYFFRVDIFNQNKNLFTDHAGAIVLNELQAQDIDDEMDWKMTELKFKLLNDLS